MDAEMKKNRNGIHTAIGLGIGYILSFLFFLLIENAEAGEALLWPFWTILALITFLLQALVAVLGFNKQGVMDSGTLIKVLLASTPTIVLPLAGYFFIGPKLVAWWNKRREQTRAATPTAQQP